MVGSLVRSQKHPQHHFKIERCAADNGFALLVYNSLMKSTNVDVFTQCQLNCRRCLNVVGAVLVAAFRLHVCACVRSSYK